MQNSQTSSRGFCCNRQKELKCNADFVHQRKHKSQDNLEMLISTAVKLEASFSICFCTTPG